MTPLTATSDKCHRSAMVQHNCVYNNCQSYHWQHAVKPDIGRELQFLATYLHSKPPEGAPHWNTAITFGMEQKLSYRKQIARQLHTPFVERISMTLKSALRVTQGHWKWNHWTDHTRLTIRWVTGRWILSWPWNVSQRSLKVIEISDIGKLGAVSYSPSIVTIWLHL